MFRFLRRPFSNSFPYETNRQIEKRKQGIYASIFLAFFGKGINDQKGIRALRNNLRCPSFSCFRLVLFPMNAFGNVLLKSPDHQPLNFRLLSISIAPTYFDQFFQRHRHNNNNNNNKKKKEKISWPSRSLFDISYRYLTNVIICFSIFPTPNKMNEV